MSPNYYVGKRKLAKTPFLANNLNLTVEKMNGSILHPQGRNKG